MSREIDSGALEGPLVVVTTTFNRCGLLRRLLTTLERQTDTDFVWVVVDDASNDTTSSWLHLAATRSPVPIQVMSNPRNLGKCASLNRVFEAVPASFYLVVDSDDQLNPNAIASIRDRVDREADNLEVGALFFSYADDQGRTLGGPPGYADTVATRAEFDSRWGKYDGCIGYFRRVTEVYRYPEYSNESYCGPTVLQLIMAPKYKICFTPVSIGTAQYQSDGLSAAGRRLRLENPLSMMAYTRLQYEQSESRLVRIRNRVMFFAYSRFATSVQTVRPLPREVIWYMAGVVLAGVWRKRHNRSTMVR